MINFLIFTVIAFIQMESILSQNPTCGIYDFNDPLILNEIQDCKALPSMFPSQPFIVKSYNESSFEPFRSTSERFLTTDNSLNWHCLCTKTAFTGNFSSMSFKMAFNLPSNETTHFNIVQLFVAERWGQQMNSSTNGWTLFDRNYTSPLIESFDNWVIGIRAQLGASSAIAIEYIKFYDPQITDEYCVPLPPTTSTTQTDAPFTTVSPTTVSPITEIPVTEVPSNGNRSSLKVDFSHSSSLSNAFRECDGYYLPCLIIKTYANATITPFNETSLYYLSNKWEGLSCLESTSIFSIRETSVIESAIFLNGLWPGAWISVSAIDVYTREKYNLIYLEPGKNKGWKLLTGNVNKTLDNVQIMVNINMNFYSQLAVEYLNIL